MSETEIKAPAGKQEIIIKRTYQAPRELVYKIVTDPQLIPEWWGPRNLTTTVERMEVRPGGQWRFIQRDPQGNIFAFHGVYHEAKAPERLVYTLEWEGMPGHVLLDIESFEEQDGITTSTSKNIFETVEDRDGMLEQGMESGTNAVTERLSELLARTSGQGKKALHADGNSVRITRIFNAPLAKVWQYWANPNDYMCWVGPKNYTACETHIDMRVGGKYINCMEGPNGEKVWSTGIYKEIVEPNRFVCSDSFADEQGNIVPASYYGMETDMPLELELAVTLEDLQGKTRMTLEHSGIPAGEISEMNRQGWNESLDKLEQCLK